MDLNNYFGRGPNAILSITGTDKSQALFIAPSIESYLSKHCQLLKEDRLYVHDGEIQSFFRDPLENFGSVSVQNGIRIEVQAQIVHMFCRFDRSVHSDAPKYSFVYQMRIMPHKEVEDLEETKEE